MTIKPWRDVLASNASISIADAMQGEIDALRQLEKKLVSQRSQISMLQEENIRQWDELVALRNDAEQHESIIAIYLDKITRLKNEPLR